MITAPSMVVAETASPRHEWRVYLPILSVGAMVVFIAVLRYGMLSAPLDRDEGEYAYSAQLVLKGFPPFLHAYSMKLPGTLYGYAFFMALFGQSAAGIRIGFLLINALSTFLVFYLGRRLSGNLAGVAAALSFAVLSTDAGVFGFHAEATHFVIFFALLGLALLLSALDSGRMNWFLLSGLAFGLGFVMKQHGALFLLSALIYVWLENREKPAEDGRGLLNRMLALCVGAVVPFLVVCMVMLDQGVFGRFIFWTFTYAHKYVAEVPLRWAWSSFYRHFFLQVISYSFPIWTLAAVGLLIVLLEPAARSVRRFLLPLFLLSFAATVPGFFFRPHYFVLILPAIALLIGCGLQLLRERWKRNSPKCAMAGAIALLIFSLGLTLVGRRFYFFDAPNFDPAILFGRNPFAEVIPIADYIRNHSSPHDRIAVLGSEPEIFFYSNRVSASGHIYMYGLMEEQPLARQMQHEFIQETEAEHPKFVVVINDNLSWLPQPKSVEDLADWAPGFLKNYKQVGFVKVHSVPEVPPVPGDAVILYARL